MSLLNILCHIESLMIINKYKYKNIIFYLKNKTISNNLLFKKMKKNICAKYQDKLDILIKRKLHLFIF